MLPNEAQAQVAYKTWYVLPTDKELFKPENRLLNQQ